jgi:hypothetical protein
VALLSLLLSPMRTTTYYTERGAPGGSTPAAGTAVQALIGNTLCAESTTKLVDNQVVLVIDVPAASERAGCGEIGRQVSVKVGGRTFTGVWDSERPQRLQVQAPAGNPKIYLPLVRR